MNISAWLREGRRRRLKTGSGRGEAGQSVVELALVLPILLGLLGAGLDYSRFNGVRTNLEAAARAAAEYAASNSTTSTQAGTDAKRIACAEFGQGASCTDPAVTVTSWVFNTTTAPGSTSHPQVTVVVQATTPFQTLFPYPLLTAGGTMTLQASGTYTIIQGR